MSQPALLCGKDLFLHSCHALTSSLIINISQVLSPSAPQMAQVWGGVQRVPALGLSHLPHAPKAAGGRQGGAPGKGTIRHLGDVGLAEPVLPALGCSAQQDAINATIPCFPTVVLYKKK